MKLSLHRLISGVSVRTRIVVLAAIPVVGFLVNGIAFTVGEAEVEHAFTPSSSVADAGRGQPRVRGALIAMRVARVTSPRRPSHELIQAFEADPAALRDAATIDGVIDDSDATGTRSV